MYHVVSFIISETVLRGTGRQVFKFKGIPSQSCGASPAIRDHSAICHPTHINVPQPGRPVLDLRGMEG